MEVLTGLVGVLVIGLVVFVFTLGCMQMGKEREACEKHHRTAE